jgi:hypothetical protein
MALPEEARKGVVLSALRAFNIFQFWPDATGAGLHPRPAALPDTKAHSAA